MRPLKKTKVDWLLEVLQDRQWHWNYELATKVGLSYNDAVYKARHLGYNIEMQQVGRQHRYRWNRF